MPEIKDWQADVNSADTYIIPCLDITLPSQLTVVNIQMPRSHTHSVLRNIVAECVAASRCEDLTGVTSMKVLGYDRTRWMSISVTDSGGRRPWSTSNENIMLDSGWKYAKMRIVYVFTCVM